MEQNYNYDENEISLSEVYNILKKNLGIIIIVTLGVALLVLLASVVLNFTKQPKFLYQAVTKFELVSYTEKSEQYQAVIDLMRGDTVLKGAMKKVNITEEVETVRKNVQVTKISNTNIFKLVVRNEDRTKAKLLANEIRAQGFSLVNNLVYIGELKLVEEAAILDEVIKTDGANVNIKRNTVVGGILGFISIVFLILFKHSLNPKIMSEEDVTRRFRQRVLVSIPDYDPETGIKRYLRIR